MNLQVRGPKPAAEQHPTGQQLRPADDAGPGARGGTGQRGHERRLCPVRQPDGPVRWRGLQNIRAGVVQGSHLGLEIDVSTFRSVQDTFDVQRCVLRRHFGVFLRCFTHCLRVVYFPDLAQPRPWSGQRLRPSGLPLGLDRSFKHRVVDSILRLRIAWRSHYASYFGTLRTSMRSRDCGSIV